jgi:hypothetical protein
MIAKGTSWLAGCCLALILAGCGGGQTGVPTPDPIPGPPLVSALRASGLMVDTSGAVLVAGLPGAVGGQGQVIIQSSLDQVTVTSASSGSFAGTLQARAKEELSLRFAVGDRTSESVPLEVQPLAIQTPPPPGPISGVPPLTQLGGEQVLIRGQAVSGAMALLGINLDRGQVVTGVSAADQTFQLQIAAGSGDHLRVYYDAAPLTTYWELQVP